MKFYYWKSNLAVKLPGASGKIHEDVFGKSY